MANSMFSSNRLQRFVAAATPPPTSHVSAQSTKSSVKMQRQNVVRNTVICECFFQTIAKTIGDRPISELEILEQTIAIVRVSKNVAMVATTMTFPKKYKKTEQKWSRLKLLYEFRRFIGKHNVWGASTKLRFLAPESCVSRKPHVCKVFNENAETWLTTPACAN